MKGEGGECFLGGRRAVVHSRYSTRHERASYSHLALAESRLQLVFRGLSLIHIDLPPQNGTISPQQDGTAEREAPTEEDGRKTVADDNAQGAALKSRCEALLGERKAMQASLMEVCAQQEPEGKWHG